MLPPLLHSFTLLLLFLHPPSLSATHYHHNNRRLLHHPFFPITPSLPPSTSPRRNSLSSSLPFSTSPTSSPSDDTGLPFFPTTTPPPPSPPPPPTTTTTTTTPTFPANVSSLSLPTTTTTTTTHSHSNTLLTITLISATLILLLLLFLFLLIFRRRNSRSASELRPLYPHSTPTSDSKPPPLPPTTTSRHVSHTSSDFLYLGTIAHSSTVEPIYHLKLCSPTSPDLHPLPPLSSELNHLRRGGGGGDEQFFSPTNSSVNDFCKNENDFFNNSDLLKSCFSSTEHDSPGRDSDVSVEIQALAEKAEFVPAPPPPPRGPPTLVGPSGPVVLKRSGNLGLSGERSEGVVGGVKPKLKALYWDKVRSSSDRVTVWDQLHPGSFQLNEEMIETLFTANGAKDGARRSILPLLNGEYRVLDPKKSQNIAILLKALSVTEKEVCEALLEGNADALGIELLESLLKMAPTKEEERKLLEYKDESPMKLGPAENFLRAVLNVPFAFKKVDAMLYMATFDSDVEYLRKAFETLEAACEQLRNSRVFLKLIEAVLKTGNRMNVGTNRGDAQAFKLDTLLKLIDIKGRDGKTTLLHFVVQEIVKAEGSRNSQTARDPKPESQIQSAVPDQIESRKRGLEVVSSLGGELVNVKKAAAMDSDVLSSDVSKLTHDITKINEVLKLNEENQMMETNKRFTESMTAFLEKSKMEVGLIQSQERNAFAKVKELTEYFHGNLSKEEAHPFRIFMVVRDFLGVLDQVCKEVGKINERTIMSTVRQCPTSVNPAIQPPFPELITSDGDSSSENENENIVKA
ncbi:hypothetical protein KSS87_007261 [Heliosperma pusillum]|nr:hypothetical protein KSS87_007261 [Heliosperma pusillum]